MILCVEKSVVSISDQREYSTHSVPRTGQIAKLFAKIYEWMI